MPVLKKSDIMLQSQIIAKRLSRHFLTIAASERRQRSSLRPFLFSTQNFDTAQIASPSMIRSSSTAALRRPPVATASPFLRDREMERYLQDSLSQFLPNAVRTSSQLDLELGEDIDDLSLGSLAFADSREDNSWMREDDDEADGLIEEEHFGAAIAPVRAHTPAIEEESPANQQKQSKQKSVMELLAGFSPVDPPKIEDYESREVGLEAIQLWLECEAQQEAVFRYQKVIDDARARNDFSSLSMVQRQIVRWFGPLQEMIEKRQKEFITKEGPTVPSGKKFGPYLCSLPSAKLAVIVAHEAVIYSALNSGNPSKDEGRHQRHHSVLGVPISGLANHIGQAVEDELVVHRVLHKRAQDALSEAKARADGNGFEQNVSSIFAPSEEASLFDANDTTAPDGMDAMAGNINITHEWTYATSHLRSFLDEISMYRPSAKKRRVTRYAIQRARQVVEREEEWSINEKVQLGAALLQILLETATILDNGRDEMAFSLEKRWVSLNKTQSYIAMNDRLYKMIVSDKLESLAATTTRHKPMIVLPKPWTAAKDGGYRMLKVDLMRYHGCHTQREALRNSESSTVFDGLNALGRVKWKINKSLLHVAQRCWSEDIPLGDIPSRTDLEIPEEPEAPIRSETKLVKGTIEYETCVADYRQYRERLARHNRLKQKNMVRIAATFRLEFDGISAATFSDNFFLNVAQDLRSLRCSAILKLDQAEKFQDFDEIYFPYNMDFRGRAYPIPPHLSNVGSDLCRGLLMFAEEKPLGERGLHWLKVHLANFAGKDKMTFDARAKFVDDNIDRIRESATDPFAGERWWMTLEDPFQGLATCFEIVGAIDSGDPSSYMCSLPVHMDGSCNGLQHYAALGRDAIGGKAVNLCAMDEPQDVYIGVMHEVVRRVALEADREVDFDASDIETLSRKQKKELNIIRAAKLVNGLIDRGVVKRTVMTSVYGVTYIGARQQIQEKIESKVCHSIGAAMLCIFADSVINLCALLYCYIDLSLNLTACRSWARYRRHQ